MENVTVIGVGELLWDLLSDGKQPGGAPANFVYHAQALGAKGYVVSAVGQDELGTEILSYLASIDLDTHNIARIPEYPTGTVTVALDAEGVPDFTIHNNVAWDYIPITESIMDIAGKADVVCFGTLAQRSAVSKQSIAELLGATKTDCIRVYDVNLRQLFHNKETVLQSLEYATIVKLNEDELPIIADYCGFHGSELEMTHHIRSGYNLTHIVLTKGEQGSLIAGPDFISEKAAPSVAVADTVGAGDSFTAAVIIGLLNGQSIDIIHMNATALSAYVCTQKGAAPPLSDEILKELVQRK